MDLELYVIFFLIVISNSCESNDSQDSSNKVIVTPKICTYSIQTHYFNNFTIELPNFNLQFLRFKYISSPKTRTQIIHSTFIKIKL